MLLKTLIGASIGVRYYIVLKPVADCRVGVSSLWIFCNYYYFPSILQYDIIMQTLPRGMRPKCISVCSVVR